MHFFPPQITKLKINQPTTTTFLTFSASCWKGKALINVSQSDLMGTGCVGQPPRGTRQSQINTPKTCKFWWYEKQNQKPCAVSKDVIILVNAAARHKHRAGTGCFRFSAENFTAGCDYSIHSQSR